MVSRPWSEAMTPSMVTQFGNDTNGLLAAKPLAGAMAGRIRWLFPSQSTQSFAWRPWSFPVSLGEAALVVRARQLQPRSTALS